MFWSEEEAICMPHLLCQFTKLSGKIVKGWRFDENNLIKSESKDVRLEFPLLTAYLKECKEQQENI